MRTPNLNIRPLVKAAELSILLIGLTACGSSGGGEDLPAVPPPPVFSYTKPADLGDGWTTTDAADLGVDFARLEAMMHALPSEFEIVDSIAIAYQGQLVFDETVRVGLNEFDSWVNNTNLSMHVIFRRRRALRPWLSELPSTRGSSQVLMFHT